MSRKAPPRRRRGLPSLLIGLASAAFVLLVFLGYRYLATRWPSPTTATLPEVRITEVAAGAPTAVAEPVKEPVAISDHFTARYDAAGKLIEIKAEPGEKAAPASISALPPALPVAAQGISLARAAAALAGLRALYGATYDLSHHQLLLIGEAGPSPFQPDDLRVAFRAALNHDDPTVSIDPGPKQGEMVVRFTGPVTETHFGMVMFEADRRMKALALGQDNLTNAPITVAVPGFRTQLDLIEELEHDLAANKASSWHRFWFVPEGMRVEESADGKTMRFLDADLRVLTECMDEQLRPLPNCVAPAANAFAAHLTDHYDAYATEFPVLAALKELGKLLSLGKWLNHRGIPVDQAWLGTEHVTHVEIPTTTRAITVNRTTTEIQGQTIITTSYSLYGGVKFQFENSYEPHTSTEPMIGQIALDRRPAPEAISWMMQDGNRELAAIAISLEPETQPGLPVADAMADLTLGQSGNTEFGLFRVPVDGQGPLGPGWALDLPALTFQPTIRAAPESNATAQSVPGKLNHSSSLTAARRVFVFRGWTSAGTRVFQAEDGQGQITWTPASGYIWEATDGTRQQFDDAGRLRAAQDGRGQQVRYAYEGDELRRIERDGGNWITLAYQSGRLVEARASDGQVRVYDYSTSGRLTGIRDGLGKSLIAYEYDADGRLTAIGNPDSTLARRNHYDLDGRLTGFSQNGNTFSFHRAGDGYEIMVETSANKDIAIGKPTSTSAVEQATMLVNDLTQWIISQPHEKVAIERTLATLGLAQLLELRSLERENRHLYGQMLEQAELDALTGDASRAMLSGEEALDLKVYGSGDRRLVIYTVDEMQMPGRSKVIEKLAQHFWLQHKLDDARVVSLAASDSALKVLAGDRFAMITPQELETPSDRLRRMLEILPGTRSRAARTAAELAERHPEKLGQLLVAKGLVTAGAAVVGFDGDLTELNFQRVFPQARVYRTQGVEAEAILARLQRQRDLKVNLADIAVINGIPTDAIGMKNIGEDPATATIWRDAHEKWNAAATNRGVAVTSGGALELGRALQSKPLVPILVAHSNGYTILLPDGSRFDASTLTPEVRQAIKANAPVVWLFSCRTGSVQNGQALVQALLDAGAAGVIAPITDIYAEESAGVLGHFLDEIKGGQSFLDALDSALKTEGGKWFENHIGRILSSPTSQYAI